MFGTGLDYKGVNRIERSMKMPTKRNKLIITLLITMIALTGAAFAQHGGGGHGGGGNGGGCDQDSLILVDLSGTVLIDSVEFGFMNDSSGTCEEYDSSFYWGAGHNGNRPSHGYGNPESSQHASYDPMVERESDRDSLHAVYFLDIDGDGVEDYVLNFGPYWYTPEDSNLTRPEAGDFITVTGALMEDSPMWDLDVVIVTVLNGEGWRELGQMGGGMMPPEMLENPVLGRHNNSPNPFNPSTVIYVELLADANLNVSIYDLRGREIKNLVGQNYIAGNYQFLWDGQDQMGSPVPSGVYIYTIQSGNNITSSQITLLK